MAFQTISGVKLRGVLTTGYMMSHGTEHVKKHNRRYVSVGNPRIIHEQPLHPLKAAVWCRVTRGTITGTYF